MYTLQLAGAGASNATKVNLHALTASNPSAHVKDTTSGSLSRSRYRLIITMLPSSATANPCSLTIKTPLPQPSSELGTRRDLRSLREAP